MDSSSEDTRSVAERRTARLLATPLLSHLAEESSREALAFEIGLGTGLHTIPAEMSQRESYLRFETHEEGAVLIHRGDLATEMFVVLSGTAGAFLVEPEYGTTLVDSYEEGDWFGETSALSHQPSLVSVRATSRCEVVSVDDRLFRLLYGEDDAFRGRINERYREKSLILHLRAAPLFASVSNEDLPGIREHAQLISFQKGDVIAAEGAPVDHFYLVRSGGVKCTAAASSHKQKVLAYYMGNSSFGEHSILTSDARWPATYEAMAWTDVVALPRGYFEHLLATNPSAHRVLTVAANLVVSEEDGSRGRLCAEPAKPTRSQRLWADEVEVMVHKESLKGGEALVIRQSRCIRCNVCVESCVAVHDDGIPRLSKTGAKVSTDDVLVTACYSCDIPECMLSCNYGAIRRDRQGRVRFVLDNCVGCAACIDACPYDVIRMVDSPAELARAVINLGGEETEVEGKAVKCDLCAGLPFEACVYNCPTSAITRRSPESLFEV